jgi:hypothetical protein
MDDDEFGVYDDDSDDFEEPEEISELDNFELCNFEVWWDEEGSILSSTTATSKEIAQAAWLAAYRFYVGG